MLSSDLALAAALSLLLRPVLSPDINGLALCRRNLVRGFGGLPVMAALLGSSSVGLRFLSYGDFYELLTRRAFFGETRYCNGNLFGEGDYSSETLTYLRCRNSRAYYRRLGERLRTRSSPLLETVWLSPDVVVFIIKSAFSTVNG